MNSMFRRATMLALVVSFGCNKATEAAVGASPSAPSAPAVAAAPPEPALVAANAPAPAGISLAPQTIGGQRVAVPTGGDWQSEAMGMGTSFSSEATGITVMVQKQSGVPAEARTEYLAGLVQSNQRDAPQYRVVAQGTGSVAGKVGARVDGTFNNGEAFATRDYIVFVNGAAVAIMVRGAEANAANVKALADAIASSI